MTESLIPVGSYRTPAKFDPQTFKIEQAKANAIIEFAAKVKDWPLVAEAVDAKIEDQEEFVRWWRENVRSDGRPTKTSLDRGMFSMRDAEHVTGIANQRVSDWEKALAEKSKYRDRLILAARRKAGLEPAENHRGEGTGENEWFTPAQYIEAARNVMGGIDLDPATHPIAQQVIQAATFFTRDDDGLAKAWHGRVWLNPPYSQPQIWQFIEKLVNELCVGNVSEAILLTHNYTDTAWFHHAESIAALICFTRGRIAFVDTDGEKCAPTQGQAFFYYGEHGEQFRSVFSDFGFIR